MTLREEMLTDLPVIENELGVPTFTWNGAGDPFNGGTDYPCTPGSAANFAVLTEGGFSVNLDMVLTVRQDLFTVGNFPLHQQRVKYRGEGYRIYEVRKDATTAYMRLLLINDTKGI